MIYDISFRRRSCCISSPIQPRQTGRLSSTTIHSAAPERINTCDCQLPNTSSSGLETDKISIKFMFSCKDFGHNG